MRSKAEFWKCTFLEKLFRDWTLFCLVRMNSGPGIIVRWIDANPCTAIRSNNSHLEGIWRWVTSPWIAVLKYLPGFDQWLFYGFWLDRRVRSNNFRLMFGGREFFFWIGWIKIAKYSVPDLRSNTCLFFVKGKIPKVLFVNEVFESLAKSLEPPKFRVKLTYFLSQLSSVIF